MSLASTTEKIRNIAQTADALGSTVKFAMPDLGVIYLDGQMAINEVTNDEGEADCTITMAEEDLNAMLDGKLNAMDAFMQGKMQIDGDMSVAMAMQGMFA